METSPTMTTKIQGGWLAAMQWPSDLLVLDIAVFSQSYVELNYVMKDQLDYMMKHIWVELYE